MGRHQLGWKSWNGSVRSLYSLHPCPSSETEQGREHSFLFNIDARISIHADSFCGAWLMAFFRAVRLRFRVQARAEHSGPLLGSHLGNSSTYAHSHSYKKLVASKKNSLQCPPSSLLESLAFLHSAAVDHCRRSRARRSDLLLCSDICGSLHSSNPPLDILRYIFLYIIL